MFVDLLHEHCLTQKMKLKLPVLQTSTRANNVFSICICLQNIIETTKKFVEINDMDKSHDYL